MGWEVGGVSVNGSDLAGGVAERTYLCGWDGMLAPAHMRVNRRHSSPSPESGFALAGAGGIWYLLRALQ